MLQAVLAPVCVLGLGPCSSARGSERMKKGQTNRHIYNKAGIRWGLLLATGNLGVLLGTAQGLGLARLDRRFVKKQSKAVNIQEQGAA